MKDFKSILIGFLSATCLFLFMGQTNSQDGAGKYQAFQQNSSSGNSTIHMLNTQTGEMWLVPKARSGVDIGFWEQWIEADAFYDNVNAYWNSKK